MRKIIRIVGRLSLIASIVIITIVPTLAATSDSFADFDGSERIRVAMEAPGIEEEEKEEEEFPREELLMEEEQETFTGEEEYRDIEPEPSVGESEEPRQ